MLDAGGLNSGVYTVKVILVHKERVVLRREVDFGLGELEENAAIEAHDEEDPTGLRRRETEDLGEEGC